MNRILRSPLVGLISLVVVSAAPSAAIGQSKIPSTEIPIQKLMGASGLRAADPAERNYTYSRPFECEEGVVQHHYVLRGDTGTYFEDWCGSLLNGELVFVGDQPINVDGVALSGYRYNGTDESGAYGYFFGSDDVTGQGGYVITFSSPFGSGEPVFDWYDIAARTQP